MSAFTPRRCSGCPERKSKGRRTRVSPAKAALRRSSGRPLRLYRRAGHYVPGILNADGTNFRGVLEDPCVGSKKHRIEMSRGSNEQAIQRVGQCSTRDAARIESNHRRELRHANACIVQRVANPLFQRSCEPNAAEGMQRGGSKIVTGETRIASRASALASSCRARRPTRRTSPSALHSQTWVSSSSTTQLRSMSYLPSIGSKGRSYLSTVPFREPKNDFFAGSATAPASPRAFHAWSRRTQPPFADAVHQFQTPGLELSRAVTVVAARAARNSTRRTYFRHSRHDQNIVTNSQ